MIRKFVITLMFATLGAAVTAAEPATNALEVLAGGVTLPSSAGRDVVVQACSSCDTYELATDERTSWEIGEEAVHLEVLRRELKANPNQLLLVQLSADRKRVVRVNLPATAR